MSEPEFTEAAMHFRAYIDLVVTVYKRLERDPVAWAEFEKLCDEYYRPKD